MGTMDIYDEITDIAGEELAVKLAERFGGSQVYFPRWNSQRAGRDQAIVRAHNNGRGLAVADLAHRYGISPRRVQQILAAAKEESSDE